MKRFKWKLQRLLDVKARQEEIKKAQLFALIQKMAEVRQNLLMQQAKLRHTLAELGKEQVQERLWKQQIFLKAVTAADEKIKELKKQLEGLGTERKALSAQILELRQFRKSLEKLRDAAKEQYEAEVRKFEQSHFDETANIAFARITYENARVCQSISV